MKGMRRGLLVTIAFLIFDSAVAAAQETSALLEALSVEYWEGTLRANPLQATSLGDRRYDHLLSDITPDGRERERNRLESLHARASALPLDGLSEVDRITRSELLAILESNIATLDCRFETWVVDPLAGPQVSFLNVPSYQPVRTPEEGRAMVQRWQAMGPYVDDHIDNLRGGLLEGHVATQAQVRRVTEALDALLKKPISEWALLTPLAQEHSAWKKSERHDFAKGLEEAVRESVRPAFERYRDFLSKKLLPAARPPEKVGLLHLPGGRDCYRGMIKRHTSLELTPDEIHEIGQNEVRAIREEMQVLGSRVLGTDVLAEILQKLRTDSVLYFSARDSVENKARQAVARAEGRMPEWFGLLPKKGCEVVRMEAHEEAHSTIAYYRQPALDGSRPGRYYINTYAPKTRPRYEAEALAFHEAVPGHHLQIAIAQDLEELPEFRKHTGCTAYFEGWALYTERLANEMGLYSSDLDRIGMLSYDAWRACRLVVDTGMHAMGWSRQQAIDFMLENTALAKNNIVNEVDRYITWPGQALGYKLGQLEILRLREDAKKRLGKRFDIKRFHDCVLRNGAVTLPTLGAIVESCVSSPSAP